MAGSPRKDVTLLKLYDQLTVTLLFSRLGGNLLTQKEETI